MADDMGEKTEAPTPRRLSEAREKGQIDAGRDMEIAKETAAILKQSEYAKKIMEKINGLSGSAVDILLHELEPGDPGK